MKKFLSIIMIICIFTGTLTTVNAADTSQITVGQIICTDSYGNEIYDPESQMEFNICFNADNTSDTDVSVNVFTATYSKDGTLINVDTINKTLPANTSDIEYIIPAKVPKCDFEIVKIMIWDENLTPYAQRTLSRKYAIVNLDSYANGKFYVDPSNAEELLISTYNNEDNQSGLHDFSWHNAGVGNKVAATYPLADTKGNSLLSDDGLLHTQSGVVYKMPERREGVKNKEALSLSYHYCRELEIDIPDAIYSKINFIASSALETTKPKFFEVTVDYTDGSSEIISDISLYKYGKSDESPESYIANLSKKAALNGTDLNNSIGSYVQLALHEYSFEISNHKIADKITFTALPYATEGYNGTSFMIPAMTLERAPLSEILAYTEEKISSSEYIAEESDAILDLIAYLGNFGIEKAEVSGADTLPDTSSKRAIYISTNGNDMTGNGSISAPFASIEKACEFITASPEYIGSWEVILREGRYNIENTIELNPKSLNSYSSVTFTSYPGENAVLSGSKKLDMTKAEPVSASIKARLHPSAAESIVAVNLSNQGIDNISHPAPAAYGAQRDSISRVIINGVPQTAARWPNEGYAIIGSCINSGSNGSGLKFTAADSSGSNIANWNTAENALLNGFFSDSDWKYDIIGFDSYDASTGVITSDVNPSAKIGTMEHPRRFYIENLLEELDIPGEWYIDKETNMLYLYPASDNDDVYISTMTDALFNVSNINNITFENLVFDGSANDGILFDHTKNCSIKNCDIKNLSGNAVRLSECTDSGIEQSNITCIGGSGVRVYGGNNLTVENTNVYIRDCIIDNFAQISRNGSESAIITNQAIGVKVSHNRISNGPSMAIHMDDCINTLMEYNDISNVQTEYADAGAIYSGSSFISQGNVIQYNYIHDIVPYSADMNGYLVGIYMDDLNSGYTIYGNIIRRVPIGIMLGGGKNLVVSNNIIMDSSVTNANSTINADSRGLGWASERASELSAEISKHIKLYPKYLEKFPHTAETYYTDSEYCGYPTSDTITNNFYYKHMGDSIYAEYKNSTYSNTYSGNYSYGTNSLDSSLYGSPFVNEANHDFTMKPNSVIANRIPEFKEIPFADIGLINKR